MKIFFPEHASARLLTNRRSALRMFALIVACFFVGASGTYLLGNNFTSLVIVVLGAGGILIGAAATGLLGRGTADRAPGTPVQRKALRTKSEWQYRPRKAIRSFAVLESASAETSDLVSPEPFTVNNSYINA